MSVTRTVDEAPRAGREGLVARSLALAASAAFFAAFLFTALARIQHPFDLEWMEGWMLEHVERLRHGLPLYPPPSLEFIPANYLPLHPLVCAGVAGLAAASGLGSEGLPWMRAVSLLASVGSMALIAGIVRRGTRSTVSGLVAAGLFAATYARSDFWLDLARGDSLHLLLLLATVAALAAGTVGPGRAAAAGVFLALAALTRQTAVPALAPVAVLLLFTARRTAIVWLATAAAITAAAILWWQWASDGWFAHYTLRVALGHPADFASLAPRLAGDLLPFAPLLIAAGWGVWRSGLAPGFAPAVVAGLAGSAIVMRSFIGSWSNVLIPAHAALALCGGWAWAAAERGGGRASSPVRALVLLQFAILIYDPLPAIPTRADREAGHQMVERLRREPRPVLVLSHAGLAARAGHDGQLFEMAFKDLADARDPVAGALRDSLAEAIREQRWSVVVMDRTEPGEPLPDAFAAGYAPAETLFRDPRVLWTRSGARTRPETIWRPIPAPGAP